MKKKMILSLLIPALIGFMFIDQAMSQDAEREMKFSAGLLFGYNSGFNDIFLWEYWSTLPSKLELGSCGRGIK